MKSVNQIVVLVSLLVITGGSMIAYKHYALGFPLFAGETQTIWKIETQLSFNALGSSIRARVSLPDPVPGREVIFGNEVTPGFTSEIIEEDGNRYIQWRKEDGSVGPVSIFLRNDVFFSGLPTQREEQPPPVEPSQLTGVEYEVLQNASAAISKSGLKGRELILAILLETNKPSSEHLSLLLRDRERRSEKTQLAIDLLALQGIPARMVRGVLLEDRLSNSGALFMLKAWLEGHWVLFDPREISIVGSNQFIEFQEGTAPLFEVIGGEKSKLRFSVLREQRAKFINAIEHARNDHSLLVDFSIYSLPVAQQSAFKLLLLMPLGALIVVILRNLVGIRTSGTFMPILISIAFLQTGLLTGLVLFLMVVGTGLIVRSYLTRLNLLLVPRIAAVLVVVIIIYGAIGIAGHKLGFAAGLSVTVFPMIILAWTIERMSILWDEEGPHEVLLQGGGSLLTASLAYLLMSNRVIADGIFLYPEVLLILLAIIISLGSYSGYRLSDLRRFEPMERE